MSKIQPARVILDCTDNSSSRIQNIWSATEAVNRESREGITRETLNSNKALTVKANQILL